MGYRCLCGEKQEKEQLKEEWKRAKRFVEVRMGERHLFHRNLLWTKYIAFDKIKNVYVRMERGESGEFLTMENYLMILDVMGKEHQMRVDHQEVAKRILSYIRENYPQIGNEVPGRRQKTKKG